MMACGFCSATSFSVTNLHACYLLTQFVWNRVSLGVFVAVLESAVVRAYQE